MFRRLDTTRAPARWSVRYVALIVFLVTLAPAPARGYRYVFYGQGRPFILGSHFTDGGHMVFIDGCSYPQRNGAEVEEILIAAAEWNRVRGMTDKFVVRWAPCGSPWTKNTSRFSRVRAKEFSRRAAGAMYPTVNWVTGKFRKFRINLDPRHNDLPEDNPPHCDARGGTPNWTLMRSMVFHEFGHALNLAHNDYLDRQSVMRNAAHDGLYCGESNRVWAMPDDAAGARGLYPTITPHSDIAPLGWKAPTTPGSSGSARSLPFDLDEPLPVCPGCPFVQEHTLSNNGTVEMRFDLEWRWSTDRELGSDTVLDTEQGFYKFPIRYDPVSPSYATTYSEWQREHELTAPATITGTNFIILNLTNISPEQRPAVNNDWTYFRSRYVEETENCTPCPEP